MQKHRIYTNIGKDQKITVELKQEHDLLEILSLKFSQQQTYDSFCADYGVVCGRVSVNNGLGIPNVRVSIFVPLTTEHEDDPVISTLYPYKNIDDKDENGYRYNLLPSRKQHGGHEATGTFPDQIDINSREEILEVFETYYKYTAKTNESGDFMIWGVPLGSQTLHIDGDLSDIGCFSLRPYDFIRQGLGVDSFKNTYTYKSSNDINSLPQIVNFVKTIEVYPFWGNKDICELGITRVDFDLSEMGIKVEPKAFLIGGTYTDTGKSAINKNCDVRRKMGRKCDLTTKEGTIEAIRFTMDLDENNRPILEQIDLNEDIPDDGSFVTPLHMNMDYLITNEFGEVEFSNDPNKGVPTSSCYRFKFSLKDSESSRVRKVASYLAPNIREYSTDENASYVFSTNFNDYPTLAVDNLILDNTDGQYYPKDYFYRFTYNKVYTVSSFHSGYYEGNAFSNDKFIGIKEISPSEEEDCSSEIVTPPTNFGIKNFTFQLLIADVLLFFEHLVNLVVFTFFNTMSKVFHTLADAVNFWPIKKLSKAIRRFAYAIQDSGQRHLYLITYPECEECNGDNSFGDVPSDTGTVLYCEIGTLSVLGSSNQTNRELTITTDYLQSTTGCTGNTIYTIDDLWANQSDYAVINGEFIRAQLTGVTGDTLDYIIKTYDPLTSGYTYTYHDGSDYFSDDSIYNLTVIKILGATVPSLPLENGCQIYDTPYDETIVKFYYIGTGRTQQTTYNPGDDVTATNIVDGNRPLVTSYDGDVFGPKTLSGESEFSDGVFTFIPGTQTNPRVWEILREYRRRKRVAKMFCGGIVNYAFIDNWLSGSLYFFQFKGKKGKFCDQVVYRNVNEDTYYYRSSYFVHSTNEWGKENDNGRNLGRPTTFVDLGPRDEFIKEICIDPSLDPNCSVVRSIGASSFQSFGEILGMAINYRMDTGSDTNKDYDIAQFFDNKGFTFINGLEDRVLDGDITQLISINNEIGIEQFDLQSPKYNGYSYQVLDPDLFPQVFAPNGFWGALPITLALEEDGQRVRLCINEPAHVDYYGNNVLGRLTESSQPVPFYLWDKKGTGFGGTTEASSDNQSWDYNNVVVQPLQGMSSGYTISGSPNDSSDKYLLLPITYTFSGLTITGSTDVEVHYDHISTVDDHILNYDSQYPGFVYLYVTGGTVNSPTSGIIYVRYGSAGNWWETHWDTTVDFIVHRTEDYYNQKQILSTPFLFYFGLKSGKTGLDKFVNLFGKSGEFKTVN